jgi:hypothetical protein
MTTEIHDNDMIKLTADPGKMLVDASGASCLIIYLGLGRLASEFSEVDYVEPAPIVPLEPVPEKKRKNRDIGG